MTALLILIAQSIVSISMIVITNSLEVDVISRNEAIEALKTKL